MAALRSRFSGFLALAIVSLGPFRPHAPVFWRVRNLNAHEILPRNSTWVNDLGITPCALTYDTCKFETDHREIQLRPLRSETGEYQLAHRHVPIKRELQPARVKRPAHMLAYVATVVPVAAA